MALKLVHIPQTNGSMALLNPKAVADVCDCGGYRSIEYLSGSHLYTTLTIEECYELLTSKKKKR